MNNINKIIVEIEKDTKELGFDQMSNIEVGKLLSTLVASKSGANILELGTGSGLSTAWIAYGMDTNSNLITVDNDKNLVAIAKRYLSNDTRIDFRVSMGEELIDELEENSLDFIFADTWPGKYHYLDETLKLLKVGGIYVIDDMLPQPNWPDGHDVKAQKLVESLKAREDLRLVEISCATGVIICTKIKTTKETNSWNVDEYGNHTAFVSQLALPVVGLLNPKKGEKIVDVGCGDGTLALEIKRSGADVIGIDLSSEMVEACKSKGIKASVCSVTDMPYKNEFDAVFSNAVLHWVKDAKGAVESIKRALKCDGRFIAEFGGEGNMQSVVNAMQEVFAKHPEFGEFNNPWYFPNVTEYKKLLQECGFEAEYIELIPRPTPMNSLSKWLDIFANGICKNLTQAQFETLKQEVEEICKDRLFNKDKNIWVLDYVRLRVRARV